MTTIERLGLRLQLATDTRTVELAETSDHPVRGKVNDDGEEYLVHVFWLQDGYGTIVWVHPDQYLTYENDTEFLEAVAWEYTQEFTSSDADTLHEYAG
jgi:hypothetical protein